MATSALPLPLSLLFDVTVNAPPAAAAGPAFNEMLFVGSSTVIPSVGANSRVRRYTSLEAITSDGFSSTDPEYLAAQAYYDQTPQPTYCSIGRQDLTSIQAGSIGTAAGTGYTVGDIVTVVTAGAQGGTFKITAANAGVPSAVSLVSGGTGYSMANDLATTGGTGTGLEIDVTAVGETPLQAVTACRTASPTWYLCNFVGTAQDSDLEAISAYIEAASPLSQHLVDTEEAAILDGATPNLAKTLQSASYRRTFTIYGTTQSGLVPNNAYLAAAAGGAFMGRNTQAAGSYFTGKFKELASMTPEPLTPSQVSAIEALDCNLYLQYRGNRNMLEQGVQASGVFFDEVLFLDMLASELQTTGVDLLRSLPALPLTDAGAKQLLAALGPVCDKYQAIGFIAPSGVWSGATIGPVSSGTPLPKGYYLYIPKMSTRTQSQIDNRQFPPINLMLVESQAAHSLTASISVTR